ncbi:hypothetical protein SAMN04488034_10545 [Salinimicrobium catena]|uniref:Permease n=1 Tax=Salinimicrobium catena TaxID=390640 RepID=A0A1H5NPA2_9FLAO|nr:permease [Salinimicrobium catena]SDL55848.1 hypothetical protein SAMN04488140_105116 [Salinimicrobium catena]SEF03383.1 hypothetical protein SAMN04488034_10545 [Salinimicrobium catena]
MEEIIKISEFILNSFIHIWPYLLITIPIAVGVQISGAAKYINQAFSKKPLVAILLATVVGAFSPFCSCGVIPVIASLLIGGVPLAPVMAFWIASPSMDPEIFFLSTATIGWDLSVWRLAATFGISLFSGYFTHFALKKGLLGKEILRSDALEAGGALNFGFSEIRSKTREILNSFRAPQLQFAASGSTSGEPKLNCCAPVKESSCETQQSPSKSSCNLPVPGKPSNAARLLTETRKATWMVVKFMFLAFLVNALITFYVPQELISSFLGGDGPGAVVTAALTGIPAYTSNLTALPLVSGLLGLGMNAGAALAFLIAGPTTTLPAMVAVYGIVKRKIFLLYLGFTLTGAVFFGILYNLIA